MPEHRSNVDHKWPRTIGVLAAVCVAALLIALVGYRLGHRTLNVQPSEPAAPSPATVASSEGTLVDERPVIVDAEWEPGIEVLNRLSGTITWAAAGPATLYGIEAGNVVYSVDEVRVVAMPGTVPAFRDIGPGVSGADVAQLQQFLNSEGYPISGADGTWRGSTTTAYRQWRVDNLLPVANSAALGEILFLPDLPISTTTTEDLLVGGLVSDGQALFVALDSAPALSLYLPADSPFQIEPGAMVEIDFAGVPVIATATDRQLQVEGGARRIDVNTAESAAPCDPWCTKIPPRGVSSWAATVVVKGPASGVILPVGALRSGPDGAPVVITADGSTKEVKVVLQVGGQAIVTGIDAGETLILPTGATP
jgi:peptidoglycan hydrolase-like protein with peptidoglycan-binding domain